MKIFWVRVVNWFAIAVILFVYQSQAHAREQIVLAQEEQQKAQIAQSNYETAINKLTDMQMQKKKSDIESGQDTEKSGVLGLSDGVYTGTGTGFGGDLTVEVTVENGKISDIFITDTHDDDEYLDKASALLDQIVDAQGTEGIDTVSGATYSSKGILEAVNYALKGK